MRIRWRGLELPSRVVCDRETLTDTFGEYSVEALVLTTGKIYKQTYFGRLVAENGKIKLVREASDTLAAQRAFSKDA